MTIRTPTKLQRVCIYIYLCICILLYIFSFMYLYIIYVCVCVCAVYTACVRRGSLLKWSTLNAREVHNHTHTDKHLHTSLYEYIPIQVLLYIHIYVCRHILKKIYWGEGYKYLLSNIFTDINLPAYTSRVKNEI